LEGAFRSRRRGRTCGADAKLLLPVSPYRCSQAPRAFGARSRRVELRGLSQSGGALPDLAASGHQAFV